MAPTRPRIILALGLSALALAPSYAQAWGLSTELKESWSEARLVFPVLKNKRIRYCIQNEAPERFDGESLAYQVEAALQLWLDPLKDIGLRDVAIERVDCVTGAYDLLLEVGPETTWTTLGSYQLSSGDPGRYYSLVKFDSTFLSRVGTTDYPIVDFRSYSTSLADEKQLLRKASLEYRETVPSFAARHTLDPTAVFFSTYPSLLHELGHSFGLCDTYDAPLKDQCDPHFTSAEQPASVMRDASYFYLMPDDITAIRRLFTRFR